ncbi:MAG: hypothetical protein Q9214_003097 [Letrouitia sp. 1 TL-2023]
MRLLATIIIVFYPSLTIAQYFYATDAASKAGPWKVQPSADSFSEFLAANYTSDGDVSVTFDTSPIDRDGNYSVLVYTPGCVQTGDCDRRGTVSIVGHYASKTVDGVSASTRMAQTNSYDKYDVIYQGGVNASGGAFKSSVKLASIPGSGGVIVAQAIKFDLLEAFESSGSARTEPAGPSQSSQTGTSNATPTIPNVTVTASADARSKGLNEGAKIGIGVGVSLGVILCLVVALLIYLRVQRKQRAIVGKGSLHDGSGAEDESGLAKAQLQGESSHTEMLDMSVHAELPQGPLHTELPGNSSHAELPGKLVHQELPDGTMHERTT